jgi:hypothetical protein
MMMINGDVQKFLKLKGIFLEKGGWNSMSCSWYQKSLYEHGRGKILQVSKHFSTHHCDISGYIKIVD